MKKISTFALIATLFSTGTFAVAPESKETAKDTANEPTIYLSVFDRTQEPSPDLNKKETSRSNKTEKVCWVATGNFGKKATVSEPLKLKPKVNSLVRLRMQKWCHHQIKNSILSLIPDQH